jgi:hypothetical protein
MKAGQRTFVAGITPAASRAAGPVTTRQPALRLDVRVRARVVAP